MIHHVRCRRARRHLHEQHPTRGVSGVSQRLRDDVQRRVAPRTRHLLDTLGKAGKDFDADRGKAAGPFLSSNPIKRATVVRE